MLFVVKPYVYLTLCDLHVSVVSLCDELYRGSSD
jgi:hypothetical protein